MKQSFTKLFVAFLALLLAPSGVWAFEINSETTEAACQTQFGNSTSLNTSGATAVLSFGESYNGTTLDLVISRNLDIQIPVGSTVSIQSLTCNAPVTVYGGGTLNVSSSSGGTVSIGEEGSFTIGKNGQTAPMNVNLTSTDNSSCCLYFDDNVPGIGFTVIGSNVTLTGIPTNANGFDGEDEDAVAAYIDCTLDLSADPITITANTGNSGESTSFDYTTSGLKYGNTYATVYLKMDIITEPDGDTPGTVVIAGPGRENHTKYLADNHAESTGTFLVPQTVTNDNKTYTVVGITSLKGFTNMTGIDVPTNITSISSDAFDGCTNLKTFTFAGSKPTVTGTEASLFTGIAAEPEMTIPKWDATWDDIYESKTWGAVTYNSVEYAASILTPLVPLRFDDDGNLTDIQHATTCVYMYPILYANYTAEVRYFAPQDANVKLSIPNSFYMDLSGYEGTYEIKQIHADAFNDSHRQQGGTLQEVTIPGDIIIEDGAFQNLTELQKVTFADGCVQSEYGNLFSNITSGTSLEADPLPPVLLYCPDTWENVGSDWAGGNWRVMANDEFVEELALPILQDNIHTVDLKVVYKIIDADNKEVALVNIIDPATEYTKCMMTIPNTVNTDYTVTQIGTEAFKDIDWLYGITMPSGLTAIEDNAFVNLTNLDYISFSNVTAEQSGFDYGEDDVKFSNIKYSDSQKTRFIKPNHWELVWDDWGAGDVSIWKHDYGSVKELVHYGIFIDDVEITNKNVEEYEENDVNIFANEIQILSDVEWGSMRIENVDEDNDEPFVIGIPEENTVTLTSGLVCNKDVIISGDGTLNVSSNSGATVQIADGKNLTIGDDQSNVIPIVNITNTGGYACVSGGTESSLGFYKANVTMETSGETLISGVEAPTLSACVVTDGGFDESSVTIEPGLGVGAVVTNYFMNDDNEYLDGYYTVTGLSPMIASFGNAISGGVSGEKPDEIEAESWDLTVPETVTDIDTQTDLAVTSVQYGLMGTDYVNSLTLPKTITSILAPAISNVTNFKKLTLSNGTSSTLISNIAENAFVSVSTGVANENPVLGIPYDWDESDLPGWDADSKTATLGGVTWDVEKNALFDIGEIATQTVQVTGENGGTLDLIYTITKLPTDTENGQVFVYKPYMPNDIRNIMDFGEVAYENPQPADVVGAVTLEPTVTIKGYTFDVVAVGANAFCEIEMDYVPCPHISSITFPESIKNIYCYAFTENEILKSVTFKGGRVENTYEFMGMEDFCDAFDGVAATLTVPASWGLVADDWNAGTWTSINYVKEVELDENGNAVETTPVNFAVADADEQTMEVTSSETLAEEGTIVIPQTMALGTDDFTVVAVADNAFEGQMNLTGVTLPKTVTSIGENAFAGCTNMTSLKLQSPFAPVVIDNSFSGANENLTVFYPAAAYNNYNDAGWTGVATFQPTVMQPNEWSTICSTQDYEVPEGLEAYIVVGIDYENCAVKVKKMDYILADTPMMLRKIGAAEDYPVESLSMFIYQPDGEQLPKVIGDDDAFIGYAPVSANAAPMELPESSGNNNMQAYILIGNSFVRWTSGTLAPYRCFLWATQEFNTASPARMAIEVVDGEATGVSDVRGKKEDVRNNWYDLSGRRLQSQPTKKGVYVNNGKLMIK